MNRPRKDPIAHLGHLAGYKCPKRVVIVEQVQRGPNGKADHRWRRFAVEALAGS